MALMASKPTEDDNNSQPGNGDYSYTVNELPESQKEIDIKVAPKKFAQAFEKAYKQLAPKVEIPGFRAGKAPRNLIEAKLGARVFEEAINMLLPEITTQIVVKLNLNPLDYAKYQIKKVSKDEGLEYGATFTVMPEVKLPDFKKLKTKRETVKIAKKELEESMERLVKSIVGDEKNSQKREEIDWAKEMQDEKLKSEADVKARMEKIMLDRKQAEAEDKFVDAFIREAIEKGDIKAPKALVDAEAHNMEHQYEHRIEKLGIKVNDFLKAQNTNIEEMRKNWRKEAEFKVAADMLFIAVAKAHEIKIDDAMIDAEIEKFTDEKVRESYQTVSGRNYITSVLIRQHALTKMLAEAGLDGKPSKK